MSAIRHIARGSCLITMIVLLAGCVIAPRGGPGYHGGYHEGYYDRAHHRWWHDNGWHDCGYNDPHCH
jgi:hypothetical protein